MRDEGVTRHESVHTTAWTARGRVKVTGEVDAEAVRLEGVVSVGGAISAGSVACRGTLDAASGLTVAKTLATNGTVRAVGPVQAARASFRGTVRITREVSVDGLLEVRGQFAAASVSAEEFRVDGGVDVPGSVNAVDVDVKIRRFSRLGIVRARTVRLLRVPPNPIERVFGRSPAPQVDRVEAGHVELAGVDVGFVRSPEILLGPGAHVTEVEGAVVRRHRSATVGPRSKTPPPHGLSR
jgi:cytoskeletal protein CcmA (bactofilin family)